MTKTDSPFRFVIFGREHIKDAAALEAECFSEPCTEAGLAHLCDSESAVAVVCTDENDGGRLLAYCGAEYVPDEAEILNVATRSDMRRRGCATGVLTELEKVLYARGVRKVFLDVRESNLPARTLYDRLGYTVTGKRRNFYRFPREDAILMMKELTGSDGEPEEK